MATVFKKMRAPLPVILRPNQYQRTASWHYINLPYSASVQSHCALVPSRNVVWAIHLLRKAYPAAQSLRAKVLILVFLTHYIGDAHQPLHVVTKVDRYCHSDKGGNSYCLSPHPNNYCSNNLHALWDHGVGYFNGKINFSSKIRRLEKEYPIPRLRKQVNILNPMHWVRTEKQYTPFIYSTPQYQKPTPHYYQKGQAIVRRQLSLAAYRLSVIMQNEFRN